MRPRVVRIERVAHSDRAYAVWRVVTFTIGRDGRPASCKLAGREARTVREAARLFREWARTPSEVLDRLLAKLT